MKILDFSEKMVNTVTLPELKETQKENDYNGRPLMGIYHYDFIEEVLNKISLAGLTSELEQIYVAQNKSKEKPGVSFIESLEIQHGKQSLNSAIVRRLLTRVVIKDDENEETNMAVAIAMHQQGLQLAFGTNVRICSNMSILSPGKLVCNYGEDKVDDWKKIVEILGDWMQNFLTTRNEEKEILRRLKEREVKENEIMEFVGRLTSIRVMRDSKIIKTKVNIPYIPLNQGQIGQFTENYIDKFGLKSAISGYDLYNLGTEFHKAEFTDVPTIFHSNYNFGKMVKQFLSIN